MSLSCFDGNRRRSRAAEDSARNPFWKRGPSCPRGLVANCAVSLLRSLPLLLLHIIIPSLPSFRARPRRAPSPLVPTQSQTIGTRCRRRRRTDDANLACHHRPLRFHESPLRRTLPRSFEAVWRARARKPTSKEEVAVAHLIAAILILIHIHISPTSSTAAAVASTRPTRPTPSALRLTPKSLFLLLVFTQGTQSLAARSLL